MAIQIVTNIDLGDGLEIRQGKAQVKVDGQTVALTPDKQLESRIVVDRQAPIDTGNLEFTVDGRTMVADKVGRIKGTEWFVLGAFEKPKPDMSWVNVFSQDLQFLEITANGMQINRLYNDQIPDEVRVMSEAGIVGTYYHGDFYRASPGPSGTLSEYGYLVPKHSPIWIDGFKERTIASVATPPSWAYGLHYDVFKIEGNNISFDLEKLNELYGGNIQYPVEVVGDSNQSVASWDGSTFTSGGWGNSNGDSFTSMFDQIWIKYGKDATLATVPVS